MLRGGGRGSALLVPRQRHRDGPDAADAPAGAQLERAGGPAGRAGLRHSAARFRLHRQPDRFRLPADDRGARRVGNRRASARVVRPPPVGLLGPQPQHEHVARPKPRQGGRREDGADHRGVVGDRAGDGAQARRRGRPRAAGGAKRGAARGGARPHRAHRRHGDGPCHRPHRRGERRESLPARGAGGRSASMYWSTTPAVRSAARCGSRWIAFTISSARWPSITSPPCA